MPLSPDTIRILLVVCLMGMALLAILYLRRRELSTTEHIVCGLLILLLPLLGPFLVIVLRPGKPAQEELNSAKTSAGRRLQDP